MNAIVPVVSSSVTAPAVTAPANVVPPLSTTVSAPPPANDATVMSASAFEPESSVSALPPLVTAPTFMSPVAELPVDSVVAALDGITIDLLNWFTGTFRVQGTAGIKAVARLFGFNWEVDDPGGRLSMLKIEVARGGGPEAAEAQEWCLAYNRSDVAAQAVIRDGLRARFPDGEA